MYNRTQNDDGTCNSRCLYCFMTIASAVKTSEELALVEQRHLCPEKILNQILVHRDCVCPDVPPADVHPADLRPADAHPAP